MDIVQPTIVHDYWVNYGMSLLLILFESLLINRVNFYSYLALSIVIFYCLRCSLVDTLIIPCVPTYVYIFIALFHYYNITLSLGSISYITGTFHQCIYP